MDRYLTSRSSTLMDDDFFEEEANALVGPSSGSSSSGNGTTPPADGFTVNPATGTYDPAQILGALQKAAITETCRARAVAILNVMVQQHQFPPATDLAWLDTILKAIEGKGPMPPECIPADSNSGPDQGSSFEWWWVAAGAGACVVIWIAVEQSKKGKKGQRKS